MIEAASGKNENSTGKPFAYSPMLWWDEYWHGMTIDRNMECMLEHFHAHAGENPVPGEDFWSAISSQPSGDIKAFYASNKVNHASLEEPTVGDYKMPHLN